MSSRRPPKRRYVTRVFGLYAGGTFRSSYVIRVPIYTDGIPHVRTTISVGDGDVQIDGYQPEVERVETPAPGVGDVLIEGNAPTVKTEFTISVGVGEITIDGYQIERQATQSTEQVLITQRVVRRFVVGSGVHRRAHYKVERRVLPLTSALDTSGIGSGTITIEGYAPFVEFAVGELILPGAGTITIQGGQLTEVVQQDLANTGIWRTFIRRTVVGSGVHRRATHQITRKHLYFATYPSEGATVSTGDGTITITGYQPTLEPSFQFAQAGQISIQGYPPSPILDGVVQTIDDDVYEAIKQAQKRRFFTSRFKQSYPQFVPYTSTVIDFVRERPQRIIGLGQGTVTVTGFAPTTSKVVPMGVGTVSIVGYALSQSAGIPIGLGTITIEGQQAGLEGLIDVQKPVGAGAVLVEGQLTSTLADGSLPIGAGDGSVVITGNQITITAQVAPSTGVGDVLIEGYAPKVLSYAQPGRGDITVIGYNPVSEIALRVIEVGIGNINILNQRIGISTPEKAANPTTGTVVYLGNQPSVITTGAWEQTAGSEVSWNQEAESTGTWTQLGRSTKTWTKL